MGRHIGTHPSVRLAQRPAQQLDLLACTVGIVHIRQGDTSDAFGGHQLGVHILAERQIRQNADFPAGVIAQDVRRRIPLGISILLGLLQGRLKGEPRPDHPSEDIVGGAVEDAADLFHLVGRQTHGQGANDGNATAHAGLKEVAHALLLSQSGELQPVTGHQLLVGGHHVLACAQSPLGEVQSHRGSADGLHHHGYLRVLLDHRKVLHKGTAIGRLVKVPHVQDVLDLYLVPYTAGDGIFILTQHLSHSGPHGAVAQDRYFYHVVHLVHLSYPANTSQRSTSGKSRKVASRSSSSMLNPEVSKPKVTAADSPPGMA